MSRKKRIFTFILCFMFCIFSFKNDSLAYNFDSNSDTYYYFNCEWISDPSLNIDEFHRYIGYDFKVTADVRQRCALVVAEGKYIESRFKKYNTLSKMLVLVTYKGAFNSSDNSNIQIVRARDRYTPGEPELETYYRPITWGKFQYSNYDTLSFDSDFGFVPLDGTALDDDVQYYYNMYDYFTNDIDTNMCVFSDFESAMDYVESGAIDKDKIIFNPNMFEYSEDICFDEFSVEVHKSNLNEAYFIRFYYKPSKFLLDNSGEVKLDWTYNIGCSIATIDCVLDLEWGEIDIDLTKNYFDFYPYEQLVECYDDISFLPNRNLFNGKDCLGFADFDNFLGFDVSYISKITDSNFEFNFIPTCQGVNGVNVSAYVDCLSGEASSSFCYPQQDSSGNYTDTYKPDASTSESHKQHYYIDVTKDNHGNNVYNYYFIDDKGISTKVDDDDKPIVDSNSHVNGDFSVGGNINVNGSIDMNHSGAIDINIHGGNDGNNNSGGNSGDYFPNINIEDDDYSGHALTDNITSIFGLRDDLETSQKNDGLFAFLRDFFAFVPFPLWGIVGFGMATVTVIAIIRIATRR